MRDCSKQRMYLTVKLVIWILSTFAVQSLPKECSKHLDSVVCDYNIPRDLPDGVKSVTVHQMMNGTSDRITIHSDLFIGCNWTKVERLTLFVQDKAIITSKAFNNLKKLLFLAIHDNLRHIESDGFIGLQQAEILDLSDCKYLHLNNVTVALNGSEKMPRLQKINLMNLQRGENLILNQKLFSVLANKNITSIDFSKTIIKTFDFQDLFDTICNRPLTLILANCTFLLMGRTHGSCSKMQTLDLSGTKLDVQQPSIYDNAVIPVGTFLPMFDFFFHVESLILDAVISDYKIHAHNMTFVLIDNDTMTLQHLSLARNNLKYVDVKLMNFPRSLQRLDLSSNDMIYFQPNFLFENNSLTSLDLSHNNMYEMAKTNSSDFGILLRVYRHLQRVYLSYNQLRCIQTDFFVGNQQLFLIDLSHNQINQVGFDLDRNNELQHINLAYNKITTLSELSLHTLQRQVMKKPTFTVDIRNNDIRCDTCACKYFIEWILNSNDNIITDMNCRRSDGNMVRIDDKALKSLNDLCQREKRILIGTMVPLAGITLLVIITITVWKYLRVGKQNRARKEVIKMIQKGRHRFRFVTFLAYSGKDEFFVEENVRKPLEYHLRDLTETNRDLICTGDRHFQLGCTIGDQMESCCHKCGSVILVISPSFCKSPHCNNEMNIAYANRKPIILMFKEHVEEKEMTPLIRVIFKLYTRVTWTARGGEYTLSTSWENICESLIDYMINTK